MTMPNKTKNTKAYIVSVDMGYGHQRAAYPLKCLASKNQIITANAYPGIPSVDKKIWKESREFYEFMSKFKKFPIVGKMASGLSFSIILETSCQ